MYFEFHFNYYKMYLLNVEGCELSYAHQLFFYVPIE